MKYHEQMPEHDKKLMDIFTRGLGGAIRDAVKEIHPIYWQLVSVIAASEEISTDRDLCNAVFAWLGTIFETQDRAALIYGIEHALKDIIERGEKVALHEALRQIYSEIQRDARLKKLMDGVDKDAAAMVGVASFSMFVPKDKLPTNHMGVFRHKVYVPQVMAHYALRDEAPYRSLQDFEQEVGRRTAEIGARYLAEGGQA